MRPSALLFLAAAAPLLAQTPPPAAAPEPAKPAAAAALSEPLRKAQEAAQKGDYAAAAKLLKEEAGKGDAEAAMGLAEFHLRGLLGKASAAEALKWFEKAASSGSAAGQYRQGLLLYTGAEGVTKDQDKGRFLIEAAAEARHPAALASLGSIAEEAADKANATSERDALFHQAREHYVKAVDAGSPDAAAALAKLLDLGLGGERDAAKATALYRKAAEAGTLVAMNEMGVRLQRGEGVERDPMAALGWFLSAAEAGSLVAMTNLGNAYEMGKGLPVNLDGAGNWYARAAKSNYGPAQFLLGRLFEEGRGTAKNPVAAYVNYHRAAANGVTDADKRRDEVGAKLTAEERKQAEAMLAPKADKPAGDGKPAPADKK